MNEKQIRKIQLNARKARAYAEFETQYGIKIDLVSVRNAARVSRALAAGDQFIAQHLVGAIPTASAKNENIVSAEEAPLIDFIRRNITLKHASNAAKEIAKTQSLVSVKVLTLADNGEARHTSPHSGMENNVFFTLGIGDHPITPLLDGAEMIVSVNVAELRAADPLALTGLWVSPHLTPFQFSRQESSVQLGDTTFHISQHWNGMSKTYHYRRANGDVYQRTLKFFDEIYASQELDKAIAHEFILHLRFIGGTYQQHILSTINDPTLSEQKKLTLISTAMTAIMPGWTTLEAKIPVAFSTLQHGVKITCPKNITDHKFSRHSYPFLKPDSTEPFSKFMKKMRKKNVDYHPSPVATALSYTPFKYNFIEELFGLGFSLNGRARVEVNFKTYNLSPLQLAFFKRHLPLCKFLLSAMQTHPDDPMVKIGLNPPDHNDIKILIQNDANDNQFLETESPKDNKEVLAIYKLMDEHFPSTRLFSLSTLALAVTNGQRSLGNYILTNTSKELLLNPDLAVKISPELTLIIILHAAAGNGYLELVKLMLNMDLVRIDSRIPSGHIVNAEREENKTNVSYFHGGNTCLHAYLGEHENLEDIAFFVESGLDPNTKNEAGETGFSIIRDRIKKAQSDRNYRDALDIMSDFDAKINEFACQRNTTLKEMKERGEYDSAKKNVISCIRNTENKVKSLNRCLDYFASKNMTPTDQTTLELQSEHHRSTVAAIIVGITPKGEKIVVLGEKAKKRRQHSEEESVQNNDSELLFPGGLKETNCIDHREAMIKEVKEETGIDLKNPLWKNAKISQHCFYKKQGAGNHGQYHHEVFVIDLGEQLHHAKLYARDDLWKIYKVPVSKMIYDPTAEPQKRYRVTLRDQSFFVRHSNAKSIEMVCSIPAADDYSLVEVLDLEFDGYYKTCDAAARGDIAELEKLKAYGALLEPKDFDHVCKVKTIPIREAIINGQIEAFKWFLSNNLKTDYINDMNLFSAAVKNKRSEILQYLCDHKVSLPQMWMALYDTDKENNTEYLLTMLNCLVQNIDTDPENQDKFLTSLDDYFNIAVCIAIKRGYKEIASQLLKDRRIKPYKLTSSDQDNCYIDCLKHGWFDLIFTLAKLEIQKTVSSLPGKQFFLIRIQKTEQAYSVQTYLEGPFCQAQDFDKTHRFFDKTRALRLFNLLILDHLCSLRQKPQSQTSQHTHFKPNPDKDLIEFVSMLNEKQAPGHEIATALLSSLNQKTIPTPKSERKEASTCILN